MFDAKLLAYGYSGFTSFMISIMRLITLLYTKKKPSLFSLSTSLVIKVLVNSSTIIRLRISSLMCGVAWSSVTFSVTNLIAFSNFSIGFETFVSESSEAEYNMKRIMEALRNYWEGKLEETEKDKLKITVYLANKSGKYQNEELDIDYDRLDEILKKNIYGGIISFLEKFNKVFKDKNLKEIYILLAGNSSKSKFVEEIFENELSEEFRQKYNIILKDAYSIEQEIDGEVIGLNSKTGVAFGLVELREGNGEVEYIPFRNTTKNEEINFKYCLGYSKKRRFIPVINFNTKYNEWIKYDEIENEKIIEVLYSGNTRAEGNEFPASECSRIRILVQDEEEGALYIRLKNPNTIEYVICEDINSFDEREIIEKELQ